MTRIIVDSELRGKLHDLKQPLELCDESGQVLARLLPLLHSSPNERIVPPISDDELERRRQEKDYSTKEVLDHLEKL